jgi:hypothetical protein
MLSVSWGQAAEEANRIGKALGAFMARVAFGGICRFLRLLAQPLTKKQPGRPRDNDISGKENRAPASLRNHMVCSMAKDYDRPVRVAICHQTQGFVRG